MKNNKIIMSVGPSVLERMANERSSDIYMISEFIDNSIQSMLDHHDVVKKITIQIDLNFKAKRLTISDNAYGIEPDRYEKVISLYSDLQESGLNRFGVGMKSAAFWYGRKLTILSKCANEIGRKVVIDIDAMNEKVKKNLPAEEVWSFEPTDDLTLHNRGTTIIIENLYDKRTKKSINEIIPPDNSKKSVNITLSEMISYRYKKFLANKTLEIDFIFTPASVMEAKAFQINNDEISKLYVTSDQYCNFGNRVTYFDPLVEEMWNKCGDAVRKEYLDVQSEINSIQNAPEVFIGGKETISAKRIINDILAKKDMWWKFDWNYDEHSTIPVEFGFISPAQTKGESIKKYSGFAVFQNNRAIVGGPNIISSSSELSVNNKWRTNEMLQTTSPIIRLFGELSLDDEKRFSVDKNKTTFDGLDSKAFIDQLMERMKEIKIVELAKIVSKILSTQVQMKNYGDGNTSQSDQVKKAADIVFHKNVNIHSVELPNEDRVGNKISIIPVKYKDEEYKIFPLMEPDMDSDRFVEVEYESDENLVVRINSNHGFWRGLFPDEKIRSELAIVTIHSISLIIALMYIYSPNEYDDSLSDRDNIVELINCGFNGRVEK